MPTTELKAILFDMGGTLFHGENHVEKAGRAQWEEMRRRGYDIGWERYQALSEEASEIFDRKYHGDIERFRYGSFMEIFFDLWGEEPKDGDLEELGKLFFEELVDNQYLADGAEEILERCREEGLTLGIITNGNELMTERRLEDAGIQDIFDVVLYSAGVRAQKSEIKPFKVFLDKTGLEGKDCLMVGDRKDEDMHAKEVGMHTVYVDRDRKEHIGEEVEPDYSISDIRELEGILEELR